MLFTVTLCITGHSILFTGTLYNESLCAVTVTLCITGHSMLFTGTLYNESLCAVTGHCVLQVTLCCLQ